MQQLVHDPAVRRRASPHRSFAPTSLEELIALVRRYPRSLIAVPIVCAALFALPALLKPRTYTASTSFMLADTQSDRSRLGDVAAQFGIAVGPGSDAARSPNFYADLLTTRAILGPVVTKPLVAAGGRQSLTDRYGIPARDTLAAAARLRKAVSVRMESQTGVISLDVSDTDPAVAAETAANMLDELNVFNLNVRKSQASAERKFISDQLAQARQDLAAAESSLRAFLAQNHSFNPSSEISFQRDRLQRDVNLRQSLFESLAQSLQRARIDEVRDAPAVTVIDSPAAPRIPDPRGLGSRILLGLVLGTIFATAVAIVRDYIAARREAETFAVTGDAAVSST
jgi:uncharacterized protein involved in exopolysaccharide biosynthesis